LSNRTQRVRIADILSNPQQVISGIPRGSILGPLLFAIFINDLPNVCNQLAKIYLFADDTKLCKHVVRDHDSSLLLQCYNKVIQWSDEWLMKLNTSKCKTITISRNKNSNVKYCYLQHGTSTVGLE